MHSFAQSMTHLLIGTYCVPIGTDPPSMSSSTSLLVSSINGPPRTTWRNGLHFTIPTPARNSAGSSTYGHSSNPESSRPRPPATPPHLQPVVQMLHRSRSRSPTTRPTPSSWAGSTIEPTEFYRGTSVAPPVLYNLATSLDNSVQQALEFLPHDQVRLHVQSILQRNSVAKSAHSTQTGATSAHCEPSDAPFIDSSEESS